MQENVRLTCGQQGKQTSPAGAVLQTSSAQLEGLPGTPLSLPAWTSTRRPPRLSLGRHPGPWAHCNTNEVSFEEDKPEIRNAHSPMGRAWWGPALKRGPGIAETSGNSRP